LIYTKNYIKKIIKELVSDCKAHLQTNVVKCEEDALQ